jgi:S1-C subfamily serine protease
MLPVAMRRDRQRSSGVLILIGLLAALDAVLLLHLLRPPEPPPETPSASRSRTEAAAAGLGVSAKRGEGGVEIEALLPDSPLRRAGFREGDRIERINGRGLGGGTDPMDLLREAARTGRMTLEVRRGPDLLVKSVQAP